MISSIEGRFGITRESAGHFFVLERIGQLMIKTRAWAKDSRYVRLQVLGVRLAFKSYVPKSWRVDRDLSGQINRSSNLLGKFTGHSSHPDDRIKYILFIGRES